MAHDKVSSLAECSLPFLLSFNRVLAAVAYDELNTKRKKIK